MRPSLLRAFVRVVAFALLTLSLLLAYCLLYKCGGRVQRLIKRAWSHGTLSILGVRLACEGEPHRAQPTLLVSNHVSYLDIPCIAACAEVVFIAKSEVAGWPLFGFLAKLTHTLFIRRHWREARRQRDQLGARLMAGQNVLLFGEGTSSNGCDVLPIKTSLLSVAEKAIVGRPIAIQPVTLHYQAMRDGTPVDVVNASLYAWWGDATLLRHLLRVMTLPGIRIRVVFGQAIPATFDADRKKLGPELRRTMQSVLWGRPVLPERAEPRPVIASVPKNKEAAIR